MWRAWLKIRLMPMWERLRGTFPFINNSMSLSTHDFTFRIFHLILLNTGWVMAYYRKLLKAELWARRESAVLSKWAVTKQSLEHKLSLSICLGAKTKFSWCHYYSCGDGTTHVLSLLSVTFSPTSRHQWVLDNSLMALLSQHLVPKGKVVLAYGSITAVQCWAHRAQTERGTPPGSTHMHRKQVNTPWSSGVALPLLIFVAPHPWAH